MSQFSATAVFKHASTAALLMTGSTPGRPRHTGHVCVFGGAFRGAMAQPQNILVRVVGWTCTSIPITTSQSTALTLTLRARRVEDALLALDLCSRKRERDTWGRSRPPSPRS